MFKALNDTFGIENEALARVLLSFGTKPKATVLESLLGLLDCSTESRAQGIRDLRRCFEASVAEQDIFLDAVDDSAVPGELILVLDKNLHMIPWEMTPSLRAVRVYRQPSFWHLRRNFEKSQVDDKEGISYILNPGGDLKNTEAYFKERVDSSWRGIVGRAPREDEFLESLSNSQLFLYFGHGGGDAYCARSKIRKLQRPAAPSFLIGCSSGKMKTLGAFCPESTFLDYLYAGCPTILVNLWDVTDKDIDKFTDSMFARLGIYNRSDGNEDENQPERNDLAASVALSRCLHDETLEWGSSSSLRYTIQLAK